MSLSDIKKCTDVAALKRLYAQADFEAFREAKEIERLESENALMFVPKKPNPKQRVMLEAFTDPKRKVFTFTGGNRSTKTTTGIWLALATMFGHYPWDPSKLLYFPHKRARKVRIVGQDWEKHIKTVIEPKLNEWWPKTRPMERKKNNVGVYAFWKDTLTSSTLEIMSNNQESELFEGWDGDLVMYDEPPKRDVRVACARGLVDRQGREYFGMTLLGEAWVSREVIKARNADGTPDDTVFNVEATIYDNVGFGISQEGVDQFAKTLTADEKEARLYGKPAYLSGLVWPQFRRDVNVRDRFDVPLDWLVDIEIDFHPAKPWAVSFLATDPVGFQWVVEEIWEKGNPKHIVDRIVRLIRQKQYRVESMIQIDPLAKGDSNNDFTVYDIMRDTLAAHGYNLGVGSKDKDNGIAMVRNRLVGENGMPALFFFKDCVRTIAQVEDYMFDPETGKPEKKDDDFCEVLYRNILRNTVWYPIEDEDDNRPRQPAMGNSITGY